MYHVQNLARKKMAQFEKAFLITLGHEGGYSFDPVDAGGETYKGVARKANPLWAGWSILDNLKNDKKNFPKNLDANSSLQSHVKALYKTNYWDVNKLDAVNDQAIAEEAFDTGVNMGVGVAARYIQEALNLLNRNQQSYPDLKVDGAIGSVTIGVLNSHPNPKAILKTMNGLQFMKYVEICKANPAQEKFFNGWLNRI